MTAQMNYHKIYNSLGRVADALGVPFENLEALPMEKQRELVRQMKEIYNSDPFTAPPTPKIDIHKFLGATQQAPLPRKMSSPTPQVSPNIDNKKVFEELLHALLFAVVDSHK